MTRHAIDTETVLRAAGGAVESQLEIVGRRWALRLRPRGLVSCRFPHVSLFEHGERECLRIDDLPSVLRCLPSRVRDNAGQWLPVLQALSDAIGVGGHGGIAALPERLESVSLDPLAWLGSYGCESEIPTAACSAAEAADTDAYSVKLHDGRFLGLRAYSGDDGPAFPSKGEGVVDLLRDLSAGPRRARGAGAQGGRPRRARPATARDRNDLEAVVHDLENLLTVVVGHLELEDGPGQVPTTRALDAARRGIDIARGRLGRSRVGAAAKPAAVSVTAVVTDVVTLLDGALDEGVEVVSALDSGLTPVFAEACSLRSTLLNLVLNACNALRGPGRIVVSARMLGAARQEAGSSTYVEIAVTDGAGTPAAVEDRALAGFQPMGNAKRSGNLDLARVRDFVEQCGGYVSIEGRKVRMQLPTRSATDQVAVNAAYDERVSA